LHKLGKNLDWQLLVKQAMSRDFIDSRLKAPWLKPVTNPVSFTCQKLPDKCSAQYSPEPQASFPKGRSPFLFPHPQSAIALNFSLLQLNGSCYN